MIKIKIIPCNINEMKRAIKEGKKIVVYGDKVIYDDSSGVEPHKWYRQQLYDACIAVEVGILDED